MSKKTRKLPLWKQAVEDIVEDYDYGDVINLDWFYDSFGTLPPEKGTLEEFKAFQLDFLANIENVKNELLEEHDMMLVSVRGVGYRIVKPKEQVKIAWEKLKYDVVKALSKGERRIVNINTEMISKEQRQERTEKLAKISQLKTFQRKRLT